MYIYIFAEKMWVVFAFTKATHFFSKNTCGLDIVHTRTVNILTTNELVKLMMLWTTGPRPFSGIVHYFDFNMCVYKKVNCTQIGFEWSWLRFDSLFVVSVVWYCFRIEEWLASVAQLATHPTGDQEIVGSAPPGSTFIHGGWSWNIFYDQSLPSADSRRAVISFWWKNVHNTG